MTKKHFIALADVVAEGPFGPEQIRILAEFCASQNPDFNYDRWIGYIAGTNGASGGKIK